MKKQLFNILCFLFISMSYAQFTGGCASTNWNGSVWSNGVPGTGLIAYIDADYDMSLNGPINQSFACCELVIQAGATLTITSERYVSVETNTTINGSGELIVLDKGSFVQVLDPTIGSGFTITDAIAGGNAIVRKSFVSPFSTAVKYWSSPIAGETVGDTFDNTPSYGGYRYYYKTENLADLTYEVNNNNATNPGIGVDSVDDNGDDWDFANQNDTVVPGLGYITRQTSAGTFNYEFDGEFNNGIIVVPVTRNDENLAIDITNTTDPTDPYFGSQLYDANAIFIGNPYASAIDLALFLETNTYSTSNPNGILDGYVAIWSASAAPVNTNNGNQASNYSESDYFYMNFIGTTLNVCESLPFTTCAPDAGGAPDPFPDPSISSGQGFFANFSDAVPSMSPNPTIGNVIFNNSMRIVDLNTKFYKTSAAKNSASLDNKLWLNLNSPSGINENILLGYAEGATSGNDGRAYDLDLNVPFNTPYSLIYFNINDSDSKFRIQGKNTSNLSSNEEVSLGFYNTIEGIDGALEEFAISITQIQGDFMDDRTTFLVDNLLDVCHDLTAAPYFFTSGIGEFNERFELRFQSCNYSEACNAIFDAFAGSIDTQGKCGKYSIKAPQGDYTGYDVVLTHDGIDINIPTNPANTTFLYTENGSNTAVLSIYDQGTGELCYRGDVDLEVDCFNNKNKSIKLFPNPAKDKFTVELNNKLEKLQHVTLRNLMGTIVKTSTTKTIMLNGVKTGIYFVEITTSEGAIYRKQLIVE